MNDLPRPDSTPLPPREGEFRRVRHRALVRRLRGPAAGIASVAIVTVAIGSVGAPEATRSVDVTTTTSPTPSETIPPSPVEQPEETESPTTSPSPSETATVAAPTPTRSPTPSVTPTWNGVECGDSNTFTVGPDVEGVVVDRAGNPLPGITITGMACENGGGTAHSGGTADVTDGAGRFSFPCYDHWAVAAPFAWYSGERSSQADVGFAWFEGIYQPVPCGSGRRIVLPAAATVNARLVDANGDPVAVAGEPIHVFMEDDTTTPLVSVESDAEGRMSFTGLAPGAYVLWASGGKYAPFTVAEGATATVDVRSG